MPGALDGVQVLEVADYITGPYCGMLLADMGADVVKIEKKVGGDPFRGFDRASGKEGYNSSFVALNRNKRSMTLNLASPQGQEIFLGLADKATVIIENHRPGQMKRWGLDYETISERNPGVVYASITGFGQDGPYKDLPGYDTLGVGMGGLLSLLTDMKNPVPSYFTFADHLTGIFGCYAILGALYARSTTGKGQHVETSLLQSISSFIGLRAASYFAAGNLSENNARTNMASAFVAQDGKPLVFHLSSPPKFWQGLTEAIGHPELQTDPRFEKRDARVKNYDALHEICQEAFATAPRDYWVEKLRSHDVPCGPLYNIQEVFEDLQVKHLGMEIALDHPKMGTVRVSGNPSKMNGTPIRYESAPPLLGESTAEILKGAGYTEAQLKEWEEAGVI